MSDLLPAGERSLLIRDFDFESKPLWFWYDKPTAVITSISYMDIVEGSIDHDSLTTEVAPLGSRVEFISWLDHIRYVLETPAILTGHNIDRFDLPLFNAQLMRNGMEQLRPLRTHDTLTGLPKRRDMSMSQESLINYRGLKDECPIGMPIYKDHLSIPEWEDAAMGWNDEVLIERPMSDVHGHAHLRETLMNIGYLGPTKRWSPGRSK